MVIGVWFSFELIPCHLAHWMPCTSLLANQSHAANLRPYARELPTGVPLASTARASRNPAGERSPTACAARPPRTRRRGHDRALHCHGGRGTAATGLPGEVRGGVHAGHWAPGRDHAFHVGRARERHCAKVAKPSPQGARWHTVTEPAVEQTLSSWWKYGINRINFLNISIGKIIENQWL